MEIKINNKTYQAKEGETVLDVCQREKIRIPTLCAFDGLPREAVCRICLVEINGQLVPSCATQVKKGMEIETESENVQKARRINLELLWADHAGKCATCKKNKMCELQALAEEYKIENFHFVPRKGEMTDREELNLVKDNLSRVVVENENPCISRNSEFCVECRRCVNVCPEEKFSFNYRSGNVVVGTPYEEVLECSFCGKCVEVCPVAALTDQNNFSEIIKNLDDLKKMAVAVLDLKVEKKILKLAEKLETSKKVPKNLEKILTDLGFEKIVTLEEGEDEEKLIKKTKTDYAKKEKINPEDIVTFFISDKINKKFKKNKYLDFVLTGREIGRLIRDKK